jgi:hypothetical protein
LESRQKIISSHERPQTEIRLPFRILLEENRDIGGKNMRVIGIDLLKNHYSKENLERIFHLYSKKYQNPEERLSINVYIGEDESRQILDRVVEPENQPNPRYPNYSVTQNLSREAASFFRFCHTPHAKSHCNEWYYYSPNLDKPEKRKYVVLKGTYPFGTRKIIEVWNTSNGTFKIEAIAYELKGVEPRGIFYAFSCPLPDTNVTGYLDEFMTIRNEKLEMIPRDQVRFVSDQIGYVFMGWIYAVTTDGGKTWSTWDAEKDLPNWQCCDSQLIQNVNIMTEGLGVMTLKLNSWKENENVTLYTKDYGKHWDKQ